MPGVFQRGKLESKGEPYPGLPNRSERAMTHSKHAGFLLSLADGVAAAGPAAAQNAIARAKSAGLDISYVENGCLKIEAANGAVRSSTPLSTVAAQRHKQSA